MATEFQVTAVMTRPVCLLIQGGIESNPTNYFIVRLKVDQRADQLSLSHLGITKTEKIELKHLKPMSK